MELLGNLLKGVVVPRPKRRRSGSVYSVKSEPRNMQNRAVQCLGCPEPRPVLLARVSRDRRLRTLRSNCCGRRMRPLNWPGWKDGRATLEGQIMKRRELHERRQDAMGIREQRELPDDE